MEEKIAAGTGRHGEKRADSSFTGIIAQINPHEIERSFLAFCEAHGFSIPTPIQADGQIHRFHFDGDARGSRNGAYVLWPDGKSFDGRPHGYVMDFKHGGEKYFWQFYSKENPTPRKELSASEQLAARERREQGAEQVRQERIDKLRAAWSSYRRGRSIEESPDHPYLLSKRVSPRGGFPFGGVWNGLRVGSMVSASGKVLSDLLFIPMVDVATGKFTALHRVFGRPDSTGKFGKGWASPAAGIFPIGIDVQHGPVFAGEGIGTMLSVYESWTENGTPEGPNEHVNSCTALAAMDSNNLIKQAGVIRERFKGRWLLIVADDDAVGRKTAAECMRVGFDGVWHVESGVS